MTEPQAMDSWITRDARITTIDLTLTRYQKAEINEHLYNLSLNIRKHELIIEIWDETSANSYFSEMPKMLKQPIGPDKLAEGFHELNLLDNIPTHQIMIVWNDHWKRTLTHEMTHVFCAELIGAEIWEKWRKIFQDNRQLDPFEFVSIACADPAIIEQYKKTDWGKNT